MYRLLVKNIYSTSKIKMSKTAITDYMMMLTGIGLMGFCISLFRIANLGTDPFSCMNLGMSAYLGWSFGTWQLLLNTVLFVIVLWHSRKSIGLGTIINMTCVGYLADFFTPRIQFLIGPIGQSAFGYRVGITLIAVILVAFAVALYMVSELGIAPYDAIGVIIAAKTNSKIPLRCSRIMTDIVCVLIGFITGSTIGLGTIITACLTGPLVQLMKEKIVLPLKTYLCSS